MDEYIKRSEVVGLVEDKLKRCDTVLEALAFASLRAKVMGLRSADVAPRAEVAREIFEEIEREFSGAYWYKGYTIERYIAELKKKYLEAEPDPPKAKQPKDSENYEKKRLLAGDCFHGEIWYMCPYCFTGIEAYSIPKDRICHKCGKEYL